METPTANVFWMLSAYLSAMDTATPPMALSKTADHAHRLKPTISSPARIAGKS
eukprot:CAMPEP_0195640778 /NCGR_PEP_ID=MMETSP0815-20121206/26335_1 /TAXON_ID=97485 /ORGANISM="Prymnesium parvum, Strain Texoma1" /LENGTH=52 /DNA_ID=CAMNT_0040783479 /DNA_START=509 /DNA_END=667 /DNA_ORIENTATION=-